MPVALGWGLRVRSACWHLGTASNLMVLWNSRAWSVCEESRTGTKGIGRGPDDGCLGEEPLEANWGEKRSSGKQGTLATFTEFLYPFSYFSCVWWLLFIGWDSNLEISGTSHLENRRLDYSWANLEQISSVSLGNTMFNSVLAFYSHLEGGVGRQVYLGGGWVLYLRRLEFVRDVCVVSLEAKLMLTEGNTRSSDPVLVTMGCQRVFSSL